MGATVDTATAVEAWAAEVLEINTYPDNPEDLGAALPVAAADISNERKVDDERGMGISGYQQTYVRVWEVQLSLMVAPDPSWEQTNVLYDFVDALADSLVKDKTLGGRVQAAAATYEVDYPGELEHPSGVRTIAALVTVTVGKQVEVSHA